MVLGFLVAGVLVAYLAAEVWVSSRSLSAGECVPNVFPTSPCESGQTAHALSGVGFFVGVALIIIGIGIIPRKRS